MKNTSRIPGASETKEENLPEEQVLETKEENLPEEPTDESKPCLTKGGWVVPTTKKG